MAHGEERHGPYLLARSTQASIRRAWHRNDTHSVSNRECRESRVAWCGMVVCGVCRLSLLTLVELSQREAHGRPLLRPSPPKRRIGRLAFLQNTKAGGAL